MKKLIVILTATLAILLVLPIIVKASSGQGITKCTTIVDENDVPIIGATMVIQGSMGIGSTSDYDGKICITGRPTDIVIITYIGHESYKIVLDKIPGKIVLSEDVDQLED